ncbi:MAG: UbiX family flavin prenyltransferase [Proteobacteria bacterium]|nr:UbiX family flavin prenyltransferase [Pseudomonadota bacterium]
MSDNQPVTVVITGASGSIYGVRLIENLLEAGKGVNLLISDPGFIVLEEEMGISWKGDELSVNQLVREYFNTDKELIYFDNSNYFSPLASGSSGRGTMVIAPCSMGTIGRIASGISANLIERAADVVLKEKGNLVLLPRETPLNAIHLENMLMLSRMGARIVPAMPGFYHKPQTMDDLINFVVGKLLDQIGIEHDLVKKWGAEASATE